MDFKDVKRIIDEGEGFEVEFKRKVSTPEKIARALVAFANTKGGYILFGIDDDREVVGVESEKSETELVKDAAENYCEPPVKYSIEYFNLKEKEIVVVIIPESGNKPHRLQDYLGELDINSSVVIIRVNDKSMQASKEMVRIIRSQSGKKELKKYFIGTVEKTVFEYLAKREKISVKELSSLVNISERRASRTLVKMVRANLLMIHTKDNGEEFFTAAA